MNEDEVVEELNKLKYPSEENGWIRKPQNNLPTYITLRKSLYSHGITPSLTWDKEDCLNAFKNDKKPDEETFDDKTTDALYSSVVKTFREERRSLDNITSMTSSLLPQISAHIKSHEEALVKKQLNMMKK